MHAPISFSIVKKLRSYNEIANLTTLKPEESSVTISYVPPPPQQSCSSTGMQSMTSRCMQFFINKKKTEIHVEHKMVTVFQCPDKQQKVYA